LVPAKGQWCSAAGKVTACLAESNGSLPPGGWLIVTYRLTACTPGSARAPMLGNEYGKPLPLFMLKSQLYCFFDSHCIRYEALKAFYQLQVSIQWIHANCCHMRIELISG